MAPKFIEMIMEIKRYGYTKTKDDLGVYFDKGNNRFSCMKHGNSFICYFNKKIEDKWVLQQQSHSFISYEFALRWIIINIQMNLG